MAIVIEENKSPRKWGTIIGVIIVVILVFSGVYLLFFKKPVLIEMAIPAPAQKTQELSQLNFNPQDIQNNPVFQALRQFAPSSTAGELGRSNPFLPF